MEHTQAQQVKLRASVHLTFEKLETIDLSLNLAAAPRRREGSAHCGQVGSDARRECAQLRHGAIAGLGQPAIKAADVATADQDEKVSCQTASNGDLGFDATYSAGNDAESESLSPIYPAVQAGRSKR